MDKRVVRINKELVKKISEHPVGLTLSQFVDYAVKDALINQHLKSSIKLFTDTQFAMNKFTESLDQSFSNLDMSFIKKELRVFRNQLEKAVERYICYENTD